MSRLRCAAAFLAAGALALGTAACAGPGNGSGGRTLTVFAAASLKAPFTELAREFEASHQGTAVTLSFAGSADLATQLSQGAPADVFASADAKIMAKVLDAGLVEGTPRNFASNVLALAVPPANPADIGSFADLARPGVKVVVCAAQVPCGAAARAVQAAAGVTLKPVSEESSVTDVLGKITSGEADAGLVYVTDVRSAGSKVKDIPFAESAAAVNRYPIAALKGSRDPDLAADFTAFVTGARGQEILAGAGFGEP
ncbi:molybdate ABC transporter substrate-binding protein [Arthrobacter sp. Hor0625]|uniref:molybdate ABC transporter substrate-binding protein n=1 Tax=Arthrobacter sp. Hor0625 TaxID=3457358 RepID=UPI00403E4777